MNICRACKKRSVKHVIGLGPQPPAQAFLRDNQLDELEPMPTLEVYVCLDCALVQIPDNVPAGFFSHYLYVSSTADLLLTHFDGLASLLQEKFRDCENRRIVDIGSCDGVLLDACQKYGLNPIGIEPATNLSEIARGKGHVIYNGYFSIDIAKRIVAEHGLAMAVTTSNTFNIIEDLDAVIDGVKEMLDEQGTFIVEVPQAADLIEKNEFDTIYHEHLSQFSAHSLLALFQRHDMRVIDIEPLELHGGSMRVFVTKDANEASETDRLRDLLVHEKHMKLFDFATYEMFRDRVVANRQEITELLAQLKQQGKSIAAYGAAAKGTTLLNYYALDNSIIDFIVDRNSMKHGLYSPGRHIPVVDVSCLSERRPDYVLMLAWNFASEILEQQKEYIEHGGKFIIPIPSCRIVDATSL